MDDEADLLVVNVTMAGAGLLGYGIHMVLFILATCLLTRRKTAGKKLLLVYTVAMALFGTTQLGLSVAQVVFTVQLFVQGGTRGQLAAGSALNLAPSFIFFTNNLVSDSLLLYRCFLIWGSQWPPVVLPGILVIATCAAGYNTTINSISHHAPLFDALAPNIFAAVTNLTLVAFTVGRIWWIRRDAMRVFHGAEVLNCYNTAIAMILESGALLLVPTILVIMPTPAVLRDILKGIAVHLINIAPTLIVVCVGLGHDIQDTVQSLHGNTFTAHPQVLHIKQSDNDDPWATAKVC